MALGRKTGGRQPGTPNKATQDVRKAIAAFAERNASKFEEWLLATAAGDEDAGVKPDPGKAADLFLKAIEYHIPKLGRVEHVGNRDEDAIQLDVTVEPSEAYKRLISGG